MNAFKQNQTPWVTASEVATAEICPYQLYLKKKGVKASKESQKRARYGNAQHNTFNKSHGLSLPTRIFLFMTLMALLGASVWVTLK